MEIDGVENVATGFTLRFPFFSIDILSIVTVMMYFRCRSDIFFFFTIKYSNISLLAL